MAIKSVFLTILITFSLKSCYENGEENKGKELAKVGEKVLYQSDVASNFPKNMSEDDSLAYLNGLVKDWVDQQVLVSHAIERLAEEEIDFSEQIERYKNSLILFRFESLYLDNNLDTAVFDEDIEAYYELNKGDYRLDENIRRIRFLASDSADMFNYRFKKWLPSDDNMDLNKLEAKVYERSYKYIQSSDKWFSNKEIADILHIPESKVDRYLRYYNRRIYARFHKGKKLHLFTEELKEKGDFKPLDFIREDIRLEIINQRKITLLKELKADLINKALNKKNAQILIKHTYE